MKEPVFGIVLRYALYVLFVGGVLFAATVPIMIDTYTYWVYGVPSLGSAYRAFLVPFLMIVSVPCLWILLEMILMLRTIPTKPFVPRNVKALCRIGVIFFLLSAAFIVKCFFFTTFLTIICSIFFVGGGMFAFTLAALINQAIKLQTENDLTI